MLRSLEVLWVLKRFVLWFIEVAVEKWTRQLVVPG